MADTKLKLKVVTPAKTLFEDAVDQVILPTALGQITVLPHHTSLVSILEPGELVVTNGEEQFPLAVFGGIIEMQNNELVVLADSAAAPSEIDMENTRKRAEELAAELESQETMDISTYNALKRQLQQEQAKLHVGTKWRK